jgi:hypothetical protein
MNLALDDRFEGPTGLERMQRLHLDTAAKRSSATLGALTTEA